MFRATLPLPLLLLLAAPAQAQVAPSATARIIDEGMNRSEVMVTAQHLTDVIGPRLTNSPAMRAAEDWTQAKFAEWGLRASREGFAFGRGWSIERSSVRMVAPRPLQLTAIPVAWTPATSGALTAPVIVAPMAKEEDFARWRGKLAGRIVMVSDPGTGDEPDRAPFQRMGDEDLARIGGFDQPEHDPARLDRQLRRAGFAARRDAFLKAEGALAWASRSYRDGKLVHGEGYQFETGRTPALPGVELAAEDYRRLARLSIAGRNPTLEIVSDVRFDDRDPQAYNIVADIPGTDAGAGYVMAGAHLDSWVAADGAADNAAGSAMVMEAARILARLGVRPRRTIRFALWNAEEQGLFGSMAYIERHVATRGTGDAPAAGEGRYYAWPNQWPITPRPGWSRLSAYFNIDNGSGRLRGVYAENNPAAEPILRDWMAPFAGMGFTTVASGRTTGTDHVFFQSVGVPGFQFVQDPLDYDSRTHHSSADTFDHLKGADMRQGATILAGMLLAAANAPQPLPRPPLPTRPTATDPFAFPTGEDED